MMNIYMVGYVEDDDENKELFQEIIEARNENSCKNKFKRNKEYKNTTIFDIIKIPSSKEFYDMQE